jgi:succinate dehydrogenase/fumarate reductase flavoprotein subunit
MDEITTHTSDVLLIGGGGAALIAACAAVDAGMSVNLVSKKPPGLASCTAYAGGGFTAALEGVSADQHRQMTVRTGCGINNPELVDVLSEEGASALNRLRNWGVNLRFRPGGASVRSEQGNPLTGGTGLTLPLLRHCREIG